MELQQFFNLVQRELWAINSQSYHAFRLATLASKGDFVGLRTVLVRHIGSDLDIMVYTDTRSKKVEELKANAEASLLFYDKASKLQVLIEAKAHIIAEGELYQEHQKKALRNPMDYASLLAPGSKIDIKDYETSTETHFTLLHFLPVSIQALKLGIHKHKRAKWFKKDEWAGTWMVP